MINRIADRIDLAIDLLTLGQYGLEQTTPVGAAGCGGSGHPADWEDSRSHARQPAGRARRFACARPRSSTSSASFQ